MEENTLRYTRHSIALGIFVVQSHRPRRTGLIAQNLRLLQSLFAKPAKTGRTRTRRAPDAAVLIFIEKLGRLIPNGGVELMHYPSGNARSPQVPLRPW